MCGIVGLAGDFSYKTQDSFNDMLIVCAVRGLHSTGVASITDKPDNPETDWIKFNCSPQDLMNFKGYSGVVSSYNKKILLGHCRHATVGKITKDTAHPFESKHIVGVHNGTLTNWRGYLDDSKDFDVDSECLIHNIAKNGPELTFAGLEGAWCTVWFDKEQDTLNFLRNDERPLYLGWSKDGKILCWASEPWMLLAAERRGEIILQRDDKGAWCSPLPLNTLWAFNVIPRADKIFNLKAPQVIKGEPLRPPVQVGVGYGANSRPYQTPFAAQQKKTQVELEGNEEPLPFLDEELPEFLRVPKWGGYGNQEPRLRLEAPISTPAESTTSKPSVKASLNSSSNVLDFRMGSKNSTKPPLVSKSQAAKTTVTLLSGSSASSSKKSVTSQKLKRPKQLVRTVSGIPYIMLPSGIEVTEPEFFKHSGTICSFCETSIKSVNQVKVVLDRPKVGARPFICTHCQDPAESIANLSPAAL